MSVVIKLSKGKTTLVDEADLPLISKNKWYANKTSRGRWYARFIGGYMHRLLMGNPPGMDVDHINGDTLDNRRSNLRLCTHTQNLQNRVIRGRKGIWKYSTRWRARITVNKKAIHLGVFDSPDEAIAAYDQAAIRYFGEFARLNRSR
jgi:HNH endonuclease